jgi:hypothetical protein
MSTAVHTPMCLALQREAAVAWTSLCGSNMACRQSRLGAAHVDPAWVVALQAQHQQQYPLLKLLWRVGALQCSSGEVGIFSLLCVVIQSTASCSLENVGHWMVRCREA